MESLLALAKLLIHIVIGATCFSGIVLVALALALHCQSGPLAFISSDGSFRRNRRFQGTEMVSNVLLGLVALVLREVRFAVVTYFRPIADIERGIITYLRESHERRLREPKGAFSAKWWH